MSAKIFPLEKILTISAQDYVGLGSDVKNNYEIIGIHQSGLYVGEDVLKAMHDFSRVVPENVEVVTDKLTSIMATGGGAGYFYVEISGVGLIPKK